MSSEELTWTCHVCGEERPDELIGVSSRTTNVQPLGLEVRVNVRRCVDRPRCVEVAPLLAQRWIDRVTATAKEREGRRA